jgi:hypothetical protein
VEPMLTSFLIRNFRPFREFSVERLGRVNLIVGKNNSGKSALLEAVELYTSNGSVTQVLINLVTNRQETLKGQPPSDGEGVSLNPVRHLFYRHEIPAPGKLGIVLGPVMPESGQLEIFLAAYRTETSDGTVTRRVLVPENELPVDLAEIELTLVAKENGKLRRILSLDRDLDEEARLSRRNTLVGGTAPRIQVEVVPTRNMTEARLATLWDQINLTGLDEEAVQALRLLDENITGIAFVGASLSKYRTSRIPIIKISGISEPLPLKTMGDGMTRIFQIIVALVNAKNGIVLIDEFENGLHWSVQPKMWKTVFRLAEELNVQVFATTHSRDCIKGYEEAWREQEEAGAFFRLDVNQDRGITATPYTYETLKDALVSDVEIR